MKVIRKTKNRKSGYVRMYCNICHNSFFSDDYKEVCTKCEKRVNVINPIYAEVAAFAEGLGVGTDV